MPSFLSSKKIQVHWLQYAKVMADENSNTSSVTQNSTDLSCIHPTFKYVEKANLVYSSMM